jgi:hypothetical protein
VVVGMTLTLDTGGDQRKPSSGDIRARLGEMADRGDFDEFAGVVAICPVVELLVAATAEHERLTVLCGDLDFVTVASVTGQRVKLVTDV